MVQYDFSSFLQDTYSYQTIPIIKKFYADTLTPVDLYQVFQDEAVYLLESRDHTSPWSRYSFVGLNPFMYIKEQGGMFLAAGKNNELLFSVDSLSEVFKKTREHLGVKLLDGDLPFKGGAVGYIGYDFVSLHEKVPGHPECDDTFAKASFYFCETLLALDHVTRELSVIHYVKVDNEGSIAAKEQAYAEGQSQIHAYSEKLMSRQKESIVLFECDAKEEIKLDGISSSYKKDDFIRDVNKIKDYIAQGDVFQAVLSQKIRVPLNVSAFQIYRILRLTNPSPYLYYFKNDGSEIVGSSPEKLIQIQNHHVEIHPIAGTRRRGRTDEEDRELAMDLLNDEKERAEHYMLVDLARNDIGRISEYGSIQTPQLMELGKFSNVMHLVSKVTGRLKDGIQPIEALTAAFPAGTVSGAPKIRAMQILNELEPAPRNLYAGSIAYVGFDGNIDSCIAIRTATIENGAAYIQAGAGIVADSVPELEWKETMNKASAMLRAISIAEKTFQSEEKAYV